MTDYIENNEQKIYEKYCEIFPERINSDTTIEDIEDIEEFVEDYIL